MASDSGASERYISLDVQCVATGISHDARDVCFVAVVDNREKVLLLKKVKPEKRVVSYLTPITGFREGDLDDGAKLSDVIAEVKRLLGPDVVLVGQSVNLDIKWLQLQEGTDYAKTVELADMFSAYNPRYGRDFTFSLKHEANTLLHAGFISDPHDPPTDAIASMKLFNKYHGKPELLEQAKQKLLSTRARPSFATTAGRESAWQSSSQKNASVVVQHLGPRKRIPMVYISDKLPLYKY